LFTGKKRAGRRGGGECGEKRTAGIGQHLSGKFCGEVAAELKLCSTPIGGQKICTGNGKGRGTSKIMVIREMPGLSQKSRYPNLEGENFQG